MVTRNQAIIVMAGVALAFAPRFEAKVQEFTQAHRTEIQMAMNQLQGKPAIPFAAPDGTPQAEPQAEPMTAPGAQAAYELASFQMQEDVAEQVKAQVRANVEQARANVAKLRAARAEMRAMTPSIRNASFVRVAGVGPEMAKLQVLVNNDKRMVNIYKLIGKKCPNVPAAPGAPSIPAAPSVSVEIGSLP
jgi:hypothetical protein